MACLISSQNDEKTELNDNNVEGTLVPRPLTHYALQTIKIGMQFRLNLHRLNQVVQGLASHILVVITYATVYLPTGKLQYSTQQVEARVEDLCGKFAQLQPDSQTLQQVGQKTATEFPNCTKSHADGSHQESLGTCWTLEQLKG